MNVDLTKLFFGGSKVRITHPAVKRKKNMEMTIAIFATGLAVLSFSFWRIRGFRAHSKFKRNLYDTYHSSDLNHSVDSLNTDSISHRWTMNNIVGKKHGRLGSRFQDLLFDSTLTATIWFSLIFGIGILVFGVILVRSIEVAGGLLIILFIGAFTILGSGDAKTSEELLSMLQSHKIEELSKQD